MMYKTLGSTGHGLSVETELLTTPDGELPSEACGQVNLKASIGVSEGDLRWDGYLHALEDNDIGHPTQIWNDKATSP